MTEVPYPPESGVRVYVVPGGKLPSRATEGSVGFDVYARAIVAHGNQREPEAEHIRKTVFDFETAPDGHGLYDRVGVDDEGKYYELRYGEEVPVGLGFVAELPFPLAYTLVPRSGLGNVRGIELLASPGLVDSDYRAEVAAVLRNKNSRKEPFRIRKHMRIAQIIFQIAVIPSWEEVASVGELSRTARGTGGLGSTGT